MASTEVVMLLLIYLTGVSLVRTCEQHIRDLLGHVSKACAGCHVLKELRHLMDHECSRLGA